MLIALKRKGNISSDITLIYSNGDIVSRKNAAEGYGEKGIVNMLPHSVERKKNLRCYWEFATLRIPAPGFPKQSGRYWLTS